jgi:hypothetical protein
MQDANLFKGVGGMRKAAVVAFVMILALFLESSANSQMWPYGIGVKGGYTRTNLTGEYSGLQWESIASFTVGLFLPYKLNDRLSLQMEVLYAQKGASIELETFDAKQTWELTYIDIPVLLKIDIPVEGLATPNFLVGPVISMLLESNMIEEVAGQKVSEIDVKVLNRDIDVGFTLGAGVDFVFDSLILVLDGRYTLGVVSIEKVKGADTKSNVFAITAGAGIAF